MSLFGSIMGKIFHHPAAAAPASTTATTDASSSGHVAAPVVPTPRSAPSAGSTVAPQNVDVGAVLSQMAAQRGGGGNYQSSILDLLKLLDLDSSLEARKGLADELGIHVAADGSAEQNIALHKAVMVKLAENG